MSRLSTIQKEFFRLHNRYYPVYMHCHGCEKTCPDLNELWLFLWEFRFVKLSYQSASRAIFAGNGSDPRRIFLSFGFCNLYFDDSIISCATTPVDISTLGPAILSHRCHYRFSSRCIHVRTAEWPYTRFRRDSEFPSCIMHGCIMHGAESLPGSMGGNFENRFFCWLVWQSQASSVQSPTPSCQTWVKPIESEASNRAKSIVRVLENLEKHLRALECWLKNKRPFPICPESHTKLRKNVPWTKFRERRSETKSSFWVKTPGQKPFREKKRSPRYKFKCPPNNLVVVRRA